MANPITEKVRISDIVLEELEGFEYCREAVTLISGTAASVVGQVLGKIAVAGATETHAGNTGNGAMTLDGSTPVLANAKAGVYTVKCVTATTNLGTFQVIDPDGDGLGQYIVGAAAFANQIKFTIADGSTDFIVGDTFLVTVAAGSLKWAQVTPAAVNGTQTAAGVLLTATDASAADAIGIALVRGPAIIKVPLTYTSGMSAGEKATALANLAAVGIVQRTAL